MSNDPQFGRKATLIVSGGGDGLDLSALHFRFKISAADEETPNTAEIRVYNLADATVKKLTGSGSEFKRVTVQAGYEKTGFGVIFDGTIRQYRIGRESATDAYVEILAADGDEAYNFGTVNRTLAGGSKAVDRINTIVGDMGLTPGYVLKSPTVKKPTQADIDAATAKRDAAQKAYDDKATAFKAQAKQATDLADMYSKTGDPQLKADAKAAQDKMNVTFEEIKNVQKPALDAAQAELDDVTARASAPDVPGTGTTSASKPNAAAVAQAQSNVNAAQTALDAAQKAYDDKAATFKDQAKQATDLADMYSKTQDPQLKADAKAAQAKMNATFEEIKNVQKPALDDAKAKLDAAKATLADVSARAAVPDIPVVDTGGVLPRGKVLWGMARAMLRNTVASIGATWNIDAGAVNVVPLRGYLPGEAVKLTSATGLVGIPEQTEQGMHARCLLNPRLRVGGLVQIANASINQTLQAGNKLPVGQLSYNGYAGQLQFPADVSRDGFYRVYVIEYSGDTRGQAWYSEITCLSIDASAHITLAAD